MTPRVLSIAIAILFIGCVVAAVVIGAVLRIEHQGSLRTTGVITGLVFVGLAIGLGRGVIRSSNIDRWFTVLASTSLAIGVLWNSGPQSPVGIAVLGIAFCLCAIGLISPFVGRHFSENRPAEQVGTDQPATALKSKAEGGEKSKPESEGRSQ